MKGKLLSQIAIVILISFPMSLQAGGLKGYLTKEGNLKEDLEVIQVQGGFAGDTGWKWCIKESGDWTKHEVFNRKLTIKGKGKLNPGQRKILAEKLAKYKLLQLPGKTGKPNVNRQMLTISFGKRTSHYYFRAGELLPKANPKSIGGRFGGIFRAVTKMTK